MTKLVYITSSGHSGSTLLDMLLGSIPGVFSTGEVSWLPWNLYREQIMEVSVTQQNICTCRSPFSSCPVWSRVIERLQENEPGRQLSQNPLSFRMRHYNSSGRYDSAPTRIDRYLNILFMKSLQKFGNSYLTSITGSREKFVSENNWAVFNTLSSVTECEYIIDSTKNMARMVHLHKDKKDDDQFFLIMLVRNILGVAASGAKRGEDPDEIAKAWLVSNISRKQIIEKLPDLRCIVVKYEDLCSNTIHEINRISKSIGSSEEIMQKDIVLHSKDYHLVAGNPMRYKEEIRVRYDDSWKNVLDRNTTDRILRLYESSCLYEWLNQKDN